MTKRTELPTEAEHAEHTALQAAWQNASDEAQHASNVPAYLRTMVDIGLAERADAREQEAWEALVDWVDAHDLEYTSYDPREGGDSL